MRHFVRYERVTITYAKGLVVGSSPTNLRKEVVAQLVEQLNVVLIS